MILSAVYMLSPIDVIPEGMSAFLYFTTMYHFSKFIKYGVFIYRNFGDSWLVGWFPYSANGVSPCCCLVSVGSVLSSCRNMNCPSTSSMILSLLVLLWMLNMTDLEMIQTNSLDRQIYVFTFAQFYCRILILR